MKITKENIFSIVNEEHCFLHPKMFDRLIKSPLFDQKSDTRGRTPFHCLVNRNSVAQGRLKDIHGNFAIIDILNHPMVHVVRDFTGRTPLHYLAWSVCLSSDSENQEIFIKYLLENKYLDKVKDKNGDTPLHDLALSRKFSKELLLKKYPWVTLGENEGITRSLITRILETPNAVKFIFS